MEICVHCRNAAEGDGACKWCGQTGRAEVDSAGYAVAFTAGTGVACAECGTQEHAVALRHYRWVTGLLIIDLLHNRAGYFCEDCRRTLFTTHMVKTCLLGWWGFIALVYRNPLAISMNLRARSKPPSNPAKVGAQQLMAPQPIAPGGGPVFVQGPNS